MRLNAVVANLTLAIVVAATTVFANVVSARVVFSKWIVANEIVADSRLADSVVCNLWFSKNHVRKSSVRNYSVCKGRAGFDSEIEFSVIFCVGKSVPNVENLGLGPARGYQPLRTRGLKLDSEDAERDRGGDSSSSSAGSEDVGYCAWAVWNVQCGARHHSCRHN